MKRWMLLSIAAVVCFGLGCIWDLSGLVALAGLLLSSWLITLGMGLFVGWCALFYFKFVKWRAPVWLIWGPVMLAGASFWILFGIWVSTKEAVLEQGAVSVADRLHYMYQGDQADRFSGRFFWMPWRDKSRLSAVREIVASQGAVLGAEEKYRAAMILQHGELPSDYEAAYYLSQEADEAGHEDARSLAEAAYDRWQLAIGKPQKYGTQSTVKIGPMGIEKQ